MSGGKDVVRLLVSLGLHHCRRYGNVVRFNEESCGKRPFSGRRGGEAS